MERPVEKFRNLTPDEMEGWKDYQEFVKESNMKVSYWFTIYTTDEDIMIAGREDFSPYFTSQFIENFVEEV